MFLSLFRQLRFASLLESPHDRKTGHISEMEAHNRAVLVQLPVTVINTMMKIKLEERICFALKLYVISPHSGGVAGPGHQSEMQGFA